jgi:hypothetical protein
MHLDRLPSGEDLAPRRAAVTTTTSPLPKRPTRSFDRLFPTPAKRLSLYLAASATTTIAATLLGLALIPDDLAHELGPIQLCQGAVLVAAAAGLLHRLHADGLAHRLAPVWVVAASCAGWLAWREIELDKHLFDLHAFSWRYFGRDLPLMRKVVFGVFSIGALAAFAWYVRRHWQPLASGLRQPWPRLVTALGAAGVLILGVSQLWDKAAFLEEFLALSAFRSAKLEPLPEEMLELIGQQLLLYAVVELNVLARRGHPALADATPDARVTGTARE